MFFLLEKHIIRRKGTMWCYYMTSKGLLKDNAHLDKIGLAVLRLVHDSGKKKKITLLVHNGITYWPTYRWGVKKRVKVFFYLIKKILTQSYFTTLCVCKLLCTCITIHCKMSSTKYWNSHSPFPCFPAKWWQFLAYFSLHLLNSLLIAEF